MDLNLYNISYGLINKNELSLEQIKNSIAVSSDSSGNETRAIWSYDQNTFLMFSVEIPQPPQPPQPLKRPTLSECFDYLYDNIK